MTDQHTSDRAAEPAATATPVDEPMREPVPDRPDQSSAGAVSDPGGEPTLAGGLDRPGEPAPAPSDQADAEETEGPSWEVLAEADPRSKGELLAELTDAEARRDEYLEDVRRARAELDNFRKRMMRQGAEQRDLGRSDVVARLLEVLDDFDRTLDAAVGSADEGLAKGVELVYGKLVDALKAQGLTRIDDTGVAFDPTRHEAVQRRDADAARDEPIVAEVFRPGYELGGRVLRAAMVAVEQ